MKQHPFRAKSYFSSFHILLIYVLILLCVSLPLTVSRYTSSAQAQSSARVAAFDGIEISYDYQPISIEVNEPLTVAETGYYVFIANFTVTNQNEVSCTYEITLKLMDNAGSSPAQYTSFTVPSNVTEYKTSQKPDSDGTPKAPVNTTLKDITGSNTTFNSGNAYYLLNGSTWKAVTPSSDGTSFTINCESVLGINKEHTYSILYFVSVESGTGFENSSIQYSAVSTQVN